MIGRRLFCGVDSASTPTSASASASSTEFLRSAVTSFTATGLELCPQLSVLLMKLLDILLIFFRSKLPLLSALLLPLCLSVDQCHECLYFLSTLLTFPQESSDRRHGPRHVRICPTRPNRSRNMVFNGFSKDLNRKRPLLVDNRHCLSNSRHFMAPTMMDELLNQKALRPSVSAILQKFNDLLELIDFRRKLVVR